MRTSAAVDQPSFVVHIEPENGATGILRDSPVLTRLSQRVDLTSPNVPIDGLWRPWEFSRLDRKPFGPGP